MAVVGKFYVSELARYGGGTKVKMNVVPRGPENKEWASATPSGTIEMHILNKVAIEQFDLSREYLVTFEAQDTKSDAVCSHWQGYWNAENGPSKDGACSLCGFDKVEHVE